MILTNNYFYFKKAIPVETCKKILKAGREKLVKEATTDMVDLLSNGFKLRIATDPNVAETYIYYAFAEAPFVNSEGVPCNAR